MIPWATVMSCRACAGKIAFPVWASTSLMKAFSWFAAAFVFPPFKEFRVAFSLASRLVVVPCGRFMPLTVVMSCWMEPEGDRTSTSTELEALL